MTYMDGSTLYEYMRKYCSFWCWMNADISFHQCQQHVWTDLFLWRCIRSHSPGKDDIFGENIKHIYNGGGPGKSSYCVQALSYCDLHKIEIDEFIEILVMYPEFAGGFLESFHVTFNLRAVSTEFWRRKIYADGVPQLYTQNAALIVELVIKQSHSGFPRPYVQTL